MDYEDLQGLLKILELQLTQLYAAVNSSKKYFWPGLLKPEAYLTSKTSKISC